MKINPINSGNIPFLKKKQPVIIQEGFIKMVPDEEADSNELIPKLRMTLIKEYGVIRGEETIEGRDEK